jgi:hypothetical protein
MRLYNLQHHTFTAHFHPQAEFWRRYGIVIFIAWPFLAFLLALNSFSLKISRGIIIAFSCLFGFTFVVPSEGVDAYRYASDFKLAAQQPFLEVFSKLDRAYEDDSSLDFGLQFLFSVLSRFTSDYRVLFSVFALLFSILLLKFIQNSYEIHAVHKSKNTLVFFVFVVSLVPLFYINHFRWYFALLLFMHAAYSILVKKNYWAFLLLATAPLVHFSFYIVIFVFILYLTIGNRNWIYLPLVGASFFFADLTLPFLEQNIGFLSEGFQERIGAYTAERYMTTVREGVEQRILILKYTPVVVKFFFLTMLLYLKYTQRSSDRAQENLFSYSMVVLAFVNFGQGIYSLGSRFAILFFLLAALYGIRHFAINRHKQLHWLSVIGIFVLGFNVLIAVRYGLEYTNVSLFSPLLPSVFVFDNGVSLLNVLK